VLAADTDPSSLAGLELVDRRGERLGKVRQVYPDGQGLGWVGVKGNLFGTEEVLVPLDGAVLEEDVLGVPVSRGRLASAPRRRPDAPLDDEERDRLRRFWTEPVEPPTAEGVPGSRESAGSPDPGAPPPEEEPGVMTASEERMLVATERVPRARVRLRKVVVTEQRTVTVPVRREEYRLIREPIEDGEAVPGTVIGESEQEVVLYEERVVVTTEVVPLERIRLVKEEVVDTREVAGSVRRERIELEDEAGGAVPAAPGSAATRSGVAAVGTGIVPTGIEPEVVDAEPVEEAEAVDAEIVREPVALPPAQPAARAITANRSTSRRSPRSDGSTPAASSTAAAAEAPPSTGASD
jgi:uncharacterized protein (TIGR02271 family)